MTRSVSITSTLSVTVFLLSGLCTSSHGSNIRYTIGALSVNFENIESHRSTVSAAKGHSEISAISVSTNWNPKATPPSASTVGQLFTCQADDDSVFLLGLSADGSAGVSEPDTGQQYTGQYAIDDGAVTVLLEGGLSLQTSELITDGQDILYMYMNFPDGSGTHCMARTLHVEEVVAANVILSCNDGAVTGNLRNDFRLYIDGAADWTYYFQLGADELSGTFIGTYRFNSVEGFVSMVFLDRDPLELRFFTASVNSADPKILSTPEEGDGSNLVGDTCELFYAQ